MNIVVLDGYAENPGDLSCRGWRHSERERHRRPCPDPEKLEHFNFEIV